MSMKEKSSHKLVLLRLDNIHLVVYVGETYYSITDLPISNIFL